jgi:hypothetical protein
LLLRAVTALGQLSELTNTATDSGRRPFRVPHEWAEQLSELAYVVYLMADQTAVDLDSSIRSIAAGVIADAASDRARAAANRDDDSWF